MQISKLISFISLSYFTFGLSITKELTLPVLVRRHGILIPTKDLTNDTLIKAPTVGENAVKDEVLLEQPPVSCDGGEVAAVADCNI